MTYTKQTWADSPDETTPITAGRLNHIETGIDTLSTELAGVQETVEGIHPTAFQPHSTGLDGLSTFGASLIDDVDVVTAQRTLDISGTSQGVMGRNHPGSRRTTAGILKDVPGPTIAGVTKLFQCPADHMAQILSVEFFNTTASSGTVVIFIMAAGGGTPVLADRFTTATVAGSTLISPTSEFSLDEGDSLWAYSTVTPGVNCHPLIHLIPKPMTGGTWIRRIDKNLPAAATLLYTCASGHWTQAQSGSIHNTTGSAITYQVSIARPTDGAAVPILQLSVGAGSTAQFASSPSLRVVLSAGDQCYITPAAVGLNLISFWNERSV